MWLYTLEASGRGHTQVIDAHLELRIGAFDLQSRHFQGKKPGGFLVVDEKDAVAASLGGNFGANESGIFTVGLAVDDGPDFDAHECTLKQGE